jgi:Putative glycosyl/glycerophosphate transferases involved in teichoic acid biosynthesis TagF/TagB/EpsJ/RodC
MNILTKLKNIHKKYKKKFDKYWFAKTRYLKYIKKNKIDDKVILLEWQHGMGIYGNIYYIAKELNDNFQYNDYNIYLSLRAGKVREFKQFLQLKGFDRINIVILSTDEYFTVLASAKYLITNNTFLPFFIKRDGQIYLNTWHGTPLKTLGKQIKNDFHSIGNAQKNFIVADYLLYPNEYTMEHMVEDYMLENLSKASILLNGYPRNSIFFDKEKAKMVKNELDLNVKRIYAYMPTWRGTNKNVDVIKANSYVVYFLCELDKLLSENELLYVNLHPVANKNIDFSIFSKIRIFPTEYETYEFLNSVDVLITDYSSVMFDFAITKKKIVLFTYDKEEYLKDRGMYIGMDELPFPQVELLSDLLDEIRSEKGYDDEGFLNKFCKYDSIVATEQICKKVILEEDTNIIERSIQDNNKEKVLLYVGNLARNGLTASFKNLLSTIDTQKRNYYITFETSKVPRDCAEILKTLPTDVKYIGSTGIMNMSVFQKILTKLYEKNILPTAIYYKFLKDCYKYEVKRQFGNIEFSNVIQFTGYEYKKILLFINFDTHSMIFVHSDMVGEIKTKKNQHRGALKLGYKNFNEVLLVTEDLIEPTKTFGVPDEKITILNNTIDYEIIKKKSNDEVVLDKLTELNCTEEHLRNILEDKSYKKIITIGRFSKEKGHRRLIDAFCNCWKDNEDIILIIIGGYGVGVEYVNILEHIKSTPCSDNIITIKSISNPYSILKKCDYFVFSSFYEGFGIVIVEADVLGKPVISTDIVGPRKFMKANNGTLVDNSEAGLYEGMKMLLNNEVSVMNVDYENYNKKIVEKFEELLDKGSVKFE